MSHRPQHTCVAAGFEPFPDAALERSLPDRFAEQVVRHRDCTAVVDGRVRLSYGELDELTNGVAAAIAERSRSRRSPIAIVVRQGVAYAAAVLGALKSGHPYVPLEPSDPPARLQAMIAGSGAELVLAEAATRLRVSVAVADGHIVDIDETEPCSVAASVDIDPDDVAYIFFTSGSTGAPKGVFDTHRNVLHNILRYTSALEIAPSDRLTLLQGPSFSGCVSSQLGALLNGAASVPFRLEEGLVRAAHWLSSERVTIYHSVPSIFRAIVARGDTFPDVRVVRLEGDRATSEDVERWRKHFSSDCILANGLGTTETGLARQLLVRAHDPVERGALPVGYGVRDMTVFVVDDERSRVEDGAVGEIAVASDYLAPGYWNRPDLTSERFEERDGTRVYFTGDLGRLDGNGCLEYLGRREGDLKVAGTRVEPAEIEGELLRVPGVLAAAVAIHPGLRDEGRLVAYTVPAATGGPDLATLRHELATCLPSAMLPTGHVELAELPLGPNGKVDRRALPHPPGPTAVASATASPDAGWLATLWADVLGVDEVMPGDDFFALGGDSLAAAEIVARVEQETGRSLSLAAFVRASTVAGLAALLSEESPTRSSLTILRAGNGAAPLVLVHGNTGNALHYAGLVRALGEECSVWALEYPNADADLRVPAIASAHVSLLEQELDQGSYLLAGFCYGGVVALELGRRLAARGRHVRIALLGITPLEFPTLVAPSAYARWQQEFGSQGLLARIARHAGKARHLPPREVPAYLAQRGRNIGARQVQRVRSRRVDAPEARPRSARDALSQYRPHAFPGRPLVVVHGDDTYPYSDTPAEDWAPLGTDGIELVVLPGSDHAMLDGGAQRLASVLTSWAAPSVAEPR